MVPSSLKDDRGRLQRVISPGWQVLLPRRAVRAHTSARARAAAAQPPDVVWRLWGGLLGCSVLVGLAVISARRSVLAGAPLSGWHLWTPVLQAALIALNLCLMWRAARRHQDRVLNALLAAQLCPSCGYALSAIPPEPDGCSVCPECGAAWRRTCEPAAALKTSPS